MRSRGVRREESAGAIAIVEMRDLRFCGMLDSLVHSVRMLTLEIVGPMEPFIVECCLI